MTGPACLNGPRGFGRCHVIAAYILIQTEVGRAAVVAAALRVVPGVSEVASVTGPYDVIARAEARDIDELGRLVVSRVQALGGVERTMTCPVVHL
jgi:DNA-binding Lrp family transcriptional regulator